MRPIKFSKEHETLYGAVFEQLGVERYQYKTLAIFATVSDVPNGEVYATENHTHGDSISILISGR